MEITILGSGGCMVIPKPLCQCRICKEARMKGVPYERTGPSAFIHDENILIDTPAESALQLNRSSIGHINYLIFSHLDPDHVEGFRIVEQISLDFRTWKAYREKQIQLILPEFLGEGIRNVQSFYGPVIDFYVKSGFIKYKTFREKIRIGSIRITAIPVDRGDQTHSYTFLKRERVVWFTPPATSNPFPSTGKNCKGRISW
jgi:phosphoribosyl 1,2-cyclic phosphate phosphodiesterase